MKNLNVGKKTLVVFGFVLLFASTITVIGPYQLNKVLESTRSLMATPLMKERLAGDWYRRIYGGSRRTIAIANSSDSSLVRFFAADPAQGTKEIEDLMAKVKPLLTSPEEQALLKEIFAARAVNHEMRAAVAKARAANDAETANRVIDEQYVPASKPYQAKLRELVDMQRKTIDAATAKIEAAGALSLRLLAALSAFLGLLVTGAGILLRNSVVAPLLEAIAVARRVSKGDLSADIVVRSRDEAGQLPEVLRDMDNELRGLVTRVIQGAGHIAGASDEIASGNLELSSRTEQQAGSLEETAASMEELTATVKRTSDNARQANQLAGSASDVAARGGVVVQQVIDTMAAAAKEIESLIDDSVTNVHAGSALVSQMDQTTQQNASLVEEAAAASETLQHQACELADAVRVFRLGAKTFKPSAMPRLQSAV